MDSWEDLNESYGCVAYKTFDTKNKKSGKVMDHRVSKNEKDHPFDRLLCLLYFRHRGVLKKLGTSNVLICR